MATQAPERLTGLPDVTQLFGRVLVGIDPSPESIEAARQAALLAGADGELTLLAAWDVPPPAAGAVVGPTDSRELDAPLHRRAAADAVATAKYALEPTASPATVVARGSAWQELLDEAQRANTTLIAVGSHGQRRIEGILGGSTATELVHNAECSVLVARAGSYRFPVRIVVGVDGSPGSAAAYAAARAIGERFGSELWPVVGHGGGGVDKLALDELVGHVREELPDEPVRALVAASADADLLVVGSRGLRGIKALGSVSARVAHEARCSVLIVRQRT